jgi:hypothetical protein
MLECKSVVHGIGGSSTKKIFDAGMYRQLNFTEINF